MPDLPNVKTDPDLTSLPEDVRRHGPRRWANIDPEMNQSPPWEPTWQLRQRRLSNRYVEDESEAERLMSEATINTPYMLGVMMSGPYVSPLMESPGEVMWNGIKQGVGNVARPVARAYKEIDAPIDIEALARMAGYIK